MTLLNEKQINAPILGLKFVLLITFLERNLLNGHFYSFVASVGILLALISNRILMQKIFWAFLLVLTSWAYINSRGFYSLANFNFVCFYTLFTIFLSFSSPTHLDEDILRKNATYIFSILMFSAGLQKLIQPNYINGYLLYDHLLLGDIPTYLAKFLDTIWGNYEEILKFNNQAMDLLTTYDSRTYTIALKPIGNNSSVLLFILQVMAWLVIIAEITLALLFLTKSFTIFKHSFYLIFIWLTTLYRPSEVEFLTLATTLSFISGQKDLKKLNYLYIGTIIIFISYEYSLLPKLVLR